MLVSDCASACASERLPKGVTVPQFTDQFERDNGNRHKDSLTMAIKKCRNMRQIACLLYSYCSACTVGLIN